MVGIDGKCFFCNSGGEANEALYKLARKFGYGSLPAKAGKALVQQLGSEIRRHPHFGLRGTNVNFVQLLGSNRIRVRTFERGVEGETLACGTGVTAAALVSSRVHKLISPVRVHVEGGDELEVSFNETNGQFTDVRLTGPAEFVFEGRIEI